MILELEDLGFTGFYQGIWDQGENEWTEIHEMKYGKYEDFEDLQFIDEWGFGENYRDKIADEYSRAFVELVNDTLGTDFELIGRFVSSPREYNFRTDEIYCKVEIGEREETIKRLVALANDVRYRDSVAQSIRANHTSRDGFISFMNNDFDKWCKIYLNEGGDIYLSCFIGYLVNAINPGCLHALNDSVYCYVCESTDYHTVEPETENAKGEWEVYEKYGSDYTDWTREHPIRYENPKPYGPNYIVLDWDEYKEMFLEHMEELEAERKYKACLDAQPKIPGLE